ncbi:cysteine-rich DPF motif domain-containing protein 1 [Lutzomyia longipalpis]|uniref:Cysteine-rich DPF motif domain-containing protein 1 n=1 Tax=Lutzomyia longipalpis TaxID=7200 RepID=A0A1B0CS23_LUTLO|nr:cysteine-rich DPF motif domain-containing protein 1 [Lutzomyia longipalpis]
MENPEPEKDQKEQKRPEEKQRIPFCCSLCSMSEKCDYVGKNPPFARKIQLIEDSYIMIDPFSPPPIDSRKQSSAERYLVLGAECSVCQRVVCRGTECSFFYTATFCTECVREKLREFPLEVQTKIRKQLQSS